MRPPCKISLRPSECPPCFKWTSPYTNFLHDSNIFLYVYATCKNTTHIKNKITTFITSESIAAKKNQWHHWQKNSSLNCFENYAYFTNHYSSKYTHKHTKSNSFRTFRDKDHHLSNYIKVSTLDINKLFQKNRFFQY